MTPAISVTGLSVSYDQKTILKNVFLDIYPGHLTGIVGPNGAGKSTLFKAILGLLKPDSGKVNVLGHPIDKVRKKVVYVPQKGDIDWDFPATVFDVVMMGRYPYMTLFSRFSSKDKDIAMEALTDVGISHLVDRQIGQLSGGQQQRVFLARALAQQAEVFLFDEPFVGVDVTTEKKIVQILKRLSAEGKSLLVVHHDLSKVHEYFDNIILLNQRIVAHGPTETTFIEEHISNTYGGQLPMLHKPTPR